MALLVEKLWGDSVSIIGYAQAAATYLPMSLADDRHKRRAQAVLAELPHDASEGLTCISCGLRAAESSLAHVPAAEVRRIIVVAGSRANATLSEATTRHANDDAVRVAARIAERGASVTVMAVGPGVDTTAMMRIAEAGRGRYHFIDDTSDLPKMLAAELRSLEDTTAMDVKIRIAMHGDTQFDDTRVQPVLGGVIVPVADFADLEQRIVVLRVKAASSGIYGATLVQLFWKNALDGSDHAVSTTASAEAVDDMSVSRVTVEVQKALLDMSIR